jgi:hypothetical protein
MTMIHPKPPRDINTKEQSCFFFNRHADKLAAGQHATPRQQQQL